MELEVDSDNDNVDHSKIEMTKAEAEALDRGLQVLIYVLDLCSLQLPLFGVVLLLADLYAIGTLLSSRRSSAYIIDECSLMCYLY